MKRIVGAIVCACVMVCGAKAGQAAEDSREMVTMPQMMQDHMLTSMRDHLVVLNEVLGDLAAERYENAAKVAEERLGMSSFALHGSSHMAAYMPKGMQEAGNALHHAASRFALAAQEVDIDRTYAGMRRLTGALNEMTAACNACHSGYRIR